MDKNKISGIVLFFFLIILVKDVYTSEKKKDPEGKIVKAIRVMGARYTKEYIITREMISKAGSPYKEENLIRDKERLDRLGIFSDVQINAEPEEDGVILRVTVLETYPYLPSINIEISDENGLSAGLGVDSPNFLGKNIKFSTYVLFGGATAYQFFFRNPWFAGNHLSYQVSFFHRKRENVIHDFNENAKGFNLTLSSYIKEYGRVGIRFSFISIESDMEGRTLSSDNKDHIPALSFFVGFDNIDSWINPRSGWWNEFEVQRSGLFGGDSSFWRSNIDLRRYIMLGSRRMLAVFSFLTLTSGNVGEDIAPWQLSGIGGTNSMRGWKIGARKGKNEFLNTIEYRHTLVKPKTYEIFGFGIHLGIQIAPYVDFGSAWNTRGEFRRNFIGGYGLGLRFLVPFSGIIRLDLGLGQEGAGIMIHLGSSEKAVMQRNRIR